MAQVTKTKTWSDNENVLYTDLNGIFDAIYNEFNGNIDNDNIKSGAAIDPAKISGTAVTLTGTQTLTNKTLTSPVINVGSDAQGDIYYRNGSGLFSRLAPGTAGQVLTTGGASANPSWAHPAYLKSQVSLSGDSSALTNDTWTKLSFNTEEFDVGGGFDTGNTKFVVPSGKAGYYHIYFQAYFYTSLADQKQFYVAIYKNGTLYKESRDTSSGPAGLVAPVIPSVSAYVHLDATDYIEFYVKSGNGDNLAKIFSNSNLTYAYIYQDSQD